MAGKKWSYKDLENMTYEEYRNIFFEHIPSGNESEDDQNGSDEDVHFAAQKRNITVRDGRTVLAMSILERYNEYLTVTVLPVNLSSSFEIATK
ncbi:unnamed protein product [Acanthoscelides obtectus]|uniref:Uncharacterized protein n=1 Tax=Acanthoscelides obtectus TaxID=200917 RepID=A0A9P0LHD4_ACAOB|nr:unnamed protein product [Acanthoscelides obtectus]CAK1680679.1 hypothetical protein AOBTE_LOCUS32837 [Acanthoscelides obtectus]